MATVAPARQPGVMTMATRRRQEVGGPRLHDPGVDYLPGFLIIPIGAACISVSDWNGITPVLEEGAFNYVGTANYSDLLRGYHIETVAK